MKGSQSISDRYECMRLWLLKSATRSAQVSISACVCMKTEVGNPQQQFSLSPCHIFCPILPRKSGCSSAQHTWSSHKMHALQLAGQESIASTKAHIWSSSEHKILQRRQGLHEVTLDRSSARTLSFILSRTLAMATLCLAWNKRAKMSHCSSLLFLIRRMRA